MEEQLVIGTFDAEALTDMHRALGARLRAHHLSQPFIDRYGEDAIQKGVVEYLRARAKGAEIREPRAFVVEAAFRRAIDELRRETRRADGAALDRILESGGQTAPAAEETAIEHLDAALLQRAIESLPAEDRQVLSLHYFEEVSDKRAGELLFMSERTFRRQLGRTLGKLGRMLGAPAPEPGSHRGFEIGVAAWASLGGVRVAAHPHLLDRLAAPLEALYRLPARIIDRLRGPGIRLAGSETPERIGAIGAGPAGKVLGGCAGAAIVCALSGVVGPGLQLGSGPGQAPQAKHEATAATRPRDAGDSSPPRPLTSVPGSKRRPEQTTPTTATSVAPSHPERRASKPKIEKQKKVATEEPPPSEKESAGEQFSGNARATRSTESGSASSSAESTSTTESAPSSQTETHPAESTASKEARAAQEVLHGALGR